MIKNEKKLYEEQPPTFEIGEAETLIDESNYRKVYNVPETQEKLFSLFYAEKKIEGFKDYFELLDANVLGQNENETQLDIPAPKKYAVITLEILDVPEEQKKSDDEVQKNIDSLD